MFALYKYFRPALTAAVLRSLPVAGVALTIATSGCEMFHAAPEASIVGAVNGVLPDATAPLVIQFDKPIKPETLTAFVVLLDTDAEGNLPDERGDDTVSISDSYLVAYFEGAGRRGEGSISDDHLTLTMKRPAGFPVGSKLAVILEPGLEGENGVATTVRRRIPFGFDFKCSGTGSSIMKSGAYYFILNVETPLKAQIQLYADLRIDPTTGILKGQFTNADRIPNVGKCPTACASTEVCKTLPTAACVPPSEKASDTETFPDFVPNAGAPTGYSFTVEGCVNDVGDGSVGFATKPADLVTTVPAVTVQALTVVAAFKKRTSDPATLEATGSGAGAQALLGDTALGPASGIVLARSLSPAETPAGIPAPPGQ